MVDKPDYNVGEYKGLYLLSNKLDAELVDLQIDKEIVSLMISRSKSKNPIIKKYLTGFNKYTNNPDWNYQHN